MQDAYEVDTARYIGGQDCRLSWGPEDVQIVGVRGGHVEPADAVDEVVDQPMCEERARAKSLLTVVNSAKEKKRKRMTGRALTVCPVKRCK